MRIFCAIANKNWEHPALVEGLKQAGHEVIVYDWIARGFDQYHLNWLEPMFVKSMVAMNDELINGFLAIHAKDPFDLFFSYLSDPVITCSALDRIKSAGIPMINYSCNNQMSFNRTHEHIGRMFDCNFYPEKNAGAKFDGIKAKSLHFPYGINPMFHTPIHIYGNNTNKVDVSFVGQLYGYRAPMMLNLGNCGMSISLASGVSYSYMKEIYYHSKLVAGFRGLSDAPIEDMDAKQLRGRDFETVAMGGTYMTEYLPELEDYFEIGKEILTFKTAEEFIEQCHKWTRPSMDQKRDKIKNAGIARVRGEYTWMQRFNTAFKTLGLN